MIESDLTHIRNEEGEGRFSLDRKRGPGGKGEGSWETHFRDTSQRRLDWRLGQNLQGFHQKVTGDNREPGVLLYLLRAEDCVSQS